MQITRTSALLLKRVDYSESDRIVLLYTKLWGKISAMAKGARKSRHRFGACLEPFCLFEAEIKIQPHREMGLLISTHPIKSFIKIMGNLERVACGYRILELTDAFEHDVHPFPKVFELLEKSLRVLEGGSNPMLVRLRYEAELLVCSGLAPELDQCVSCGQKAPFKSAFLNFSHGGLVCFNCRGKGSQAALTPVVWQALKDLFEHRAGEEATFEAADEILQSFVQYQLGKPSKAILFEKKVGQLSVF